MKHRIFIAINFPDGLKKNILELQNKLKKFDWPVRWVGESNFHLTLKFIGYIEDNELEKLKEITKQIVCKYKSFTIEFKDLLAFPDLNRPRVICLEISDNKELLNLANELRNGIDKAGIGQKEDRPFKCHATLGRVNNPAGHWQALSKVKFADSFTVKSVEIIESQLGPQGSVYSVVESFRLNE
jgi:2'-5' RNA ligase